MTVISKHNKKSFGEQVDAVYDEWLKENGLRDIPENDFKYGYQPNDNYTKNEKQAFDVASKAYLSSPEITKLYLEQVEAMYANGVFEEAYKQNPAYGFKKEELKEHLHNNMHPKTATRTMMIAEVITQRIALLGRLGITYNDDNGRFIDDTLNSDITNFRNNYRDNEKSGDYYAAILDKNSKIKTLSEGLFSNRTDITSGNVQMMLIMHELGIPLTAQPKEYEIQGTTEPEINSPNPSRRR